METLMKAPRIQFHLNVHEPIELVQMTLAFQGLGYEYQTHVREQNLAQGNKNSLNDVKLYITKIESNCILAELAPALPILGALMPVISDVNTVVDFVKNTKTTIDWLIGIAKKDDVKPEDVSYSKKKISNMRDVVKLVGQSKGADLGLKALKYEEKSGADHAVLEVFFSDDECREAEKGANRALLALEKREQADKEKVLMYFYQTNIDDPKSTGKTGDKALIQSVSKEPLSVYVLSEIDQQRIRHVLDDKSHNPLLTGFVVDVNIENDRKGLPKIYRVLRVHDVIHDDDV